MSEATEGSPSGAGAEPAGHPRVVRLTWLLTLLPFVVGGIALVLNGRNYLPAADHAMIEARVEDTLSRPPLVGLYSRGDWAHPGPLMFYVLAPFYWLTGGSTIGTHIGALAINGGSVAGMALLAKRRGGVPLMLCTVIASGLLIRTLGAEFLHDPWNTFLPSLPFGLMIFLTWSLACGDRWALPVAVFVATFLAHTHVGFLALAFPLLLWGAFWLVVSALRSDRAQPAPVDPPDAFNGSGDAPDPDDAGTGERSWRRRLQPLVRPALVAAAVGVVTWLPPFLDVLRNNPSNIQRIVRWFKRPDAEAHTLGDGLKVMTGQFSLPPEWLTAKQTMNLAGESPFLDGQLRVPWLLLPLGVAALYLMLRGPVDRRHLTGILGLTLAIGVVAVARTVGPAFDYRLRWTWVPPMVALVLVSWAGWLAARRRWPVGTNRWMVPISVVALVAVTGVNVVSAAQGGEPLEADTEVVAGIAPDTLEALPEGEGVVLVKEPFHMAAWYSRGLVRYLDRHGVDVRVEPALTLHFGAHRVYDGEPVRAELTVIADNGKDVIAAQPGMREIAEWSSGYYDLWEEERLRREETQRAATAGEIDEAEYTAIMDELETPEIEAVHHRVTVFLNEQVPPS